MKRREKNHAERGVRKAAPMVAVATEERDVHGAEMALNNDPT